MKNAATEARARRMATKLGLRVEKKRGACHANNRGGFQVVDVSRNSPVAGIDYELSADDVIQFCSNRNER